MTRRIGFVAAVGVVVAAIAAAAVLVGRDSGSSDEGEAGPGTETVLVEGPRGRILDRQGTVLVEDATVLDVRVDTRAVADLDAAGREALLAALAEVLVAASTEPIDDLLAEAGDERSVVVAAAVDPAVRDTIDAAPDRFPGVTVEPVGRRVHRYGAVMAHVLGHVGVPASRSSDHPGARVGLAGVEAAFDAELAGEPGRIVYEVDASGQRVRELPDLRTEPTPGRDVYLTLDVDLQHLVETGLAAEVERRRGVVDSGCFLQGGCDPEGAAAVALDPRNGQVLALASYPTFDPALLAAGPGGDPQPDLAVAGQYPPASTWKPFTAHAGLAAGLITADEVFDDTGIYRYSAECPAEDVDDNCSARNAGSAAHGEIALADALRVSSDTYFYALGDEAWRSADELGETVLQDGLAAWGFGAPTGIDLADEAAGRVPTPEWLRAYSEDLNADDPELAAEAGRWTSGVSGNLAVGQGDVLVTPLQLAQGYATLANGGTIWRPQLLLQTTAPASAEDVRVAEPERTGTVDLPAEWADPIVAGLDGVTKEPDGTATTAFSGFDQGPCPVMGKTGTAQVTGRNDTSLFAAVAPTPAAGREATIALAVVVDGGGFGAAAAVPVARRVLEPFASVACDITAFGAEGGPYEAPLGGAIDVEAAIAAFVPPPADSGD